MYLKKTEVIVFIKHRNSQSSDLGLEGVKVDVNAFASSIWDYGLMKS